MDYREDYLNVLVEKIIDIENKLEKLSDLKGNAGNLLDIFKNSLSVDFEIKSFHEEDVDCITSFEVDKMAIKAHSEVEDELEDFFVSLENDKSDLICKIDNEFIKDIAFIDKHKNFIESINENIYDFEYWFEVNFKIGNIDYFLNKIFDVLPIEHPYVNYKHLQYNQLNKFVEYLINREDKCFNSLIIEALKILKKNERSAYASGFKNNLNNYYNNLLVSVAKNDKCAFEYLSIFNNLFPEYYTENIQLKKIFDKFDGTQDFYFNKIINLMKIPIIKELFLRDGTKDVYYKSSIPFNNIRNINKHNLLNNSNAEGFAEALEKWIYLNEIGFDDIENNKKLNKRKI